MPLFSTALPAPLFPTYLLPSIPFRRKSSTSSTVSTNSESSVSSEAPALPADRESPYLSRHVSYIYCARCSADLCLSSQIISKGFTGRHGRAYLVSGSLSAHGHTTTVTSRKAYALPPTTSTSMTPVLPNTNMHKAVPRQLVTGAHTVSDVSCALCGAILGWKYVAAEEESQRYKVGKFILETKKIRRGVRWEGDWSGDGGAEDADEAERENGGVSTGGKWERRRLEGMGDCLAEEVEFDSQDEEDCEDLFAGIWNPVTAAKRREGKRFGR